MSSPYVAIPRTTLIAGAISGAVFTGGLSEADTNSCKTNCDNNPECLGFLRSIGYSRYNCTQFRKGFRLAAMPNNYIGESTIFVRDFEEVEKILEPKIDAVQNVPGSEFASQNERYQETLMSGVMWASIGTLVLFFVFNKMS
jgi:hypothetical protein